jgi:tRNA threonylcarbamoyladenosine biosynthesis protein TsaB
MLLAIDTATRQVSLALYDGQRVLVEHSWRTASYHTAELAPQAALVLRRAEVEPQDLSGVGVALGPGSYTGLRIGLGLAKGLALAHTLPLLGVPTFQVLLRAQPSRPEGVLAVLHAGRGRVIAAAHYWDGQGWAPDGPPRVQDWAALAADLRAPTFICGEWEAATPDQLRVVRATGLAIFDSPARSLRRAGFLAEIAWERLSRKQVDDPARLAPIYADSPFAIGSGDQRSDGRAA